MTRQSKEIATAIAAIIIAGLVVVTCMFGIAFIIMLAFNFIVG